MKHFYILKNVESSDQVGVMVYGTLLVSMDLMDPFFFFFLYEMQPSESNTYADIEAVYQCLETEYGVSQEDLILYGQSVGSGPTLHLAAKLPRLRGVVLHSAILSGLRVLCHVKFTFCFDIYKVRSPTCFL
jgi:pimeloyl-ACP methyl ester carboxylesterase